MQEGIVNNAFICPIQTHHLIRIAIGLTHYTKKAHFVRAMLEAICFQTKEIIEAMENDSNLKVIHLKADGGLTNSKQLMQIQSDILGKNVGK